MLKQNKWKILISSILIILPILIGIIFWNQLPDTMTTHWGADGNPDGTMGKATAIFLLPVILLAVHFLCLLATTLDKKQPNQDKKAFNIIFWIIPFISIFANCLMYSVSLGWKLQPQSLTALLMGAMLLFIGNYMPKIMQNRTLGIKISWTLRNEENWNKTHRFAGKLWVICGFVMLPTIFLPLKWMVTIIAAILLAVVLVPMIYSYRLYLIHKKAGISYEKSVFTKTDKKIGIVSVIAIIAILIGVGFLMFTGDITYTCAEEALNIEADFMQDIAVPYDTIDSYTYQENSDAAYRTYGFGSARLSMGNFQNNSLGDHTRYTYNSCEAVIILYSGEKILVINEKTPEQTQALYELLIEKLT